MGVLLLLLLSSCTTRWLLPRGIFWALPLVLLVLSVSSRSDSTGGRGGALGVNGFLFLGTATTTTTTTTATFVAATGAFNTKSKNITPTNRLQQQHLGVDWRDLGVRLRPEQPRAHRSSCTSVSLLSHGASNNDDSRIKHPEFQWTRRQSLQALQRRGGEGRIELPLARNQKQPTTRASATQLRESKNKGDTAAPETTISRRGWIVVTGFVSLCVTAAVAKFGVLPGPWFSPGNNEMIPYTDEFLLRDVGSTILTTVLAYILARTITFGFETGYLSSKDARKLIHTLSAPLFVLFWPIFSPAQGSQVFCALVPLLNIVRLYLASTGQGENNLALAVSRSGDLKEALGGPMIYIVIVFVAILAFWRTSAAGIVAVLALAVGDGLADLVGRRFGKSNPWPFLSEQKKSVVGSLAFGVGTTVAIVGILQWILQFPHCGLALAPVVVDEIWMRAAVIGLVTAALELVPIADDNYTVPLAGAILGWILFPSDAAASVTSGLFF
ncbi:hypothetical protein ACA910_007664 [Epithemia clementina (nom. ined.)]